MQVDFVFRGVTATEDIKGFINEKTAKLGRFFPGRIHAKWTIGREQDEITAHLHLLGTPTNDMFAEARHGNLMSAVEETVDRAERQLKKQKEIVKDHHK